MPTVKELKKAIRDYKAQGHCPAYSHLTKAGLLALTKRLNLVGKGCPKKAKKPCPKARKPKPKARKPIKKRRMPREIMGLVDSYRGMLPDPKGNEYISQWSAREMAWQAYVWDYVEEIRKKLRELDMTSFRKAADRLKLSHEDYKAPVESPNRLMSGTIRYALPTVRRLKNKKKDALRQRDYKLFKAVYHEWQAVAIAEYRIIDLRFLTYEDKKRPLPEAQKKHDPEIHRHAALAKKHTRNLFLILSHHNKRTGMRAR